MAIRLRLLVLGFGDRSRLHRGQRAPPEHPWQCVGRERLPARHAQQLAPSRARSRPWASLRLSVAMKLAFFLAAAAWGCSHQLPIPGQVLLVVDTDALLPAPAGQVATQTALFDAL